MIAIMMVRGATLCRFNGIYYITHSTLLKGVTLLGTKVNIGSERTNVACDFDPR